MLERRKFVAATGGLLAAGLLPGGLVAGAAEVLDFRAIDLASGLSQAKLRALLGQTFYVRTADDGVVPARLVRITPRASKHSAANELDQFSALFQTNRPALPAGLYQVEHWLAGRTLLNLVPLGAARYRADFVLLR